MRKIQFPSYLQKDLEKTVSTPGILDSLRGIANHVFPIVGAIWLTYSLGYADLRKESTENFEIPRQEYSRNKLEKAEESVQPLQEIVEKPQDSLSEGYSIENKFRRTLRYAPQIKEAEGIYNLPEGLLAGLIMHESCGDKYAVSPVGAAGLTQLMPRTAREMGLRVWHNQKRMPIKSRRYGKALESLVTEHRADLDKLESIDERFDEKSIKKAARYLRRLYNRFRDWDLALKAYNMGPNNRKLHRISSRYSRFVRSYQDYWNTRVQELAYLPSTNQDNP